ncbi:BgTH12-04675 [Blumeria graminis f. sp. triticale]|uniref:Transmembrane 9 superfamily member n=1 Tax=Blumeria graminis f. sp. triticale TaxID=1689686 RepID=A0A9W4CV50_BLUGR|nr:BgTH12-04675 [Blumeria graminis f. sp. triticale]
MTRGFPSLLWQLPLLLSTCSSLQAFYIPGWSIKSYKDSESIPLLVNKVYSDNTQLQYAYYSLPFVCPPSGKNHAGISLLSGQSIPLNLGEVLRGDRIQQSDVELIARSDNECSFLCNRTISRTDLKYARKLVKEGYVAEWIVDNLPGATSFVTTDKSRKYYAPGFKLGYTDLDPTSGEMKYFLNNHLTIVIRYRKNPGKDAASHGNLIVGFEVYTKSVTSENRREDGCPANLADPSSTFELEIAPNKSNIISQNPKSSYNPPENTNDIDDGGTLTIPYTYSVYWLEDENIKWSHRWDLYFVNQEAGGRVHWLAIINSLIISGILSSIVAMTLAKAIRADIKMFREVSSKDVEIRSKPRSKNDAKAWNHEKSNLLEPIGDEGNDADVSSDEEFLDDQSGWKLLAGDIFRPPLYGTLLAPLVGSGMQLVFMAVGLLFLSSLGILNPSFRGGFISAGVGLFIFAGIFSGYFSSRVYKSCGGSHWRKNTLLTALLFPGLLFTLVFILNLFVWAQASSTALPFGTLISIILLWLCVQVPLVYVGSWWGYERASAWEHPTKCSSIARSIPAQPWYLRNPQATLISGVIPFGIIFIELLFVFQSVWQDKSGYYYIFGFLSMMSFILIVTVAEVTVVSIYFRLCWEDYNWWWNSFAVGSSSSIWVFAYSIWYYYNKLHIEGLVSGILFFSYMSIACAVYGLLCGTIGFLTAYAFVRRLYG